MFFTSHIWTTSIDIMLYLVVYRTSLEMYEAVEATNRHVQSVPVCCETLCFKSLLKIRLIDSMMEISSYMS